jgi:hypothetical protein
MPVRQFTIIPHGYTRYVPNFDWLLFAFLSAAEIGFVVWLLKWPSSNQYWLVQSGVPHPVG